MTVKKIFAPILLVVATVFLVGSMFLIQPQAAFAQDAVGTAAQSATEVTNPKAEAYKQFRAEFANIRNEKMQKLQALKLEHQDLLDRTDTTPSEMTAQSQQLGAKRKQVGMEIGNRYKQLGMKMGDQFRQTWAAGSTN
ncbi:MAG: hypothetical protein NW224_13415 [Leptolyngbyaceae cyanobacterium bins.302]|nr:hypothetical protein [Leptolyngbyaceae cyanobacterium bins.302]